MRLGRRAFLKTTLQGSIALGLSMAGIRPSFADGGSGGEGAEPHIRQYRVLGRTGLRVSDIGVGSYGLSDPQVLNYAIDLSYSKGRMLKSLQQSLKRLQTDHVDCILLHSVSEPGRLSDPEMFSAFRQAKEQGHVRFLGVSSHSGNLVQVMDQAVDGGTFDVLLLAYNFGEHPDLGRLLAKAHSRGVGVIAMKTLRGASRDDEERFRTPNGTLRQAAFRWVLSNPHVSGLIAAMHSFEKVRESVGASGYQPSEEEQTLLERYARLTSRRYCRIGCGHCAAACEHRVPVADILRFRMYFLQYGLEADAAAEYREHPGRSLASACFACRDPLCAKHCPFGLPVHAMLREAHQLLSMHA